MARAGGSPDGGDAAQRLIEELLKTAFSLGSVYAPLLADLPADAFPGEDPGAVLIEMLAGSALPAAHSIDEASWKSTTTLVRAVRERVLSDMRVVVQFARQAESEMLL